jgi:ferredoxin
VLDGSQVERQSTALPMPKIFFVREQKEIEVPAGTNLRKAAREAGIDIYYRFAGCPNWVAQNVLNCHGFGVCGTCGVHLLEGTEKHVKPPAFLERMRVRFYDPLTPHLAAGRIGHEKEFRLSCQTTVEGDVKVLTQPYNWFGKGTTDDLEKIGQRSQEYDALLKKKNPLQAKARAMGVTKPVKPGELDPPAPSATETKPAATETKPAATETKPAPAETKP